MKNFKTAREQEEEKKQEYKRIYSERLSIYFLQWITASGRVSQLREATGPLFIKKWFYELMTPTFGRSLPGDSRPRSIVDDRESFIKGAKLIDFDRLYKWICYDRGFCILNKPRQVDHHIPT